MKNNFTLFLILFIGILSYPMLAQSVLTDASIEAGESMTLTADTEWMLDGFVFVEEGATLTIEPGTVIKGLNVPSTGDNASALIIAKGGTINAEGTADNPIIFTAELDDVNDNEDLTEADRGLWGGVIILGNGIVGQDGGEDNIEGIPAEEPRGFYGGDDNTDNSGILKYVSIRHGGAVLGSDNEINGLTLGGVGSGTTIEYVEIFANLDDGIEWFGGAVDLKYAVAAFCGDDGFDYDQSWDGRGQFWFFISAEEEGNSGGEHDGSEAEDKLPKSVPTVYNATFIGSGAAGNRTSSVGLDIRDDAGTLYANSIFTDFGGQAIRVRNSADVDDSYSRFLNGDVSFPNNILFGFGAGDDLSSIVEVYADINDEDVRQDDETAMLVQGLMDANTSIVDPSLAGISRVFGAQGLDPRPNPGSPAFENLRTTEDEWFDVVDFKGAFSNSDNWALGWTALDANLFFGDLVSVPVLTIDDKLSTFSVFPNPIQGLTNIRFELKEVQEINIDLFDLQGRLIEKISDHQIYLPGNHILNFDADKLLSGIYLIQVTSPTSSGTIKLVKN